MLPILIAAAAKAALGGYQYYQGRKMAKNNKLENQQVGAEYTKNLASAQRMAAEGMPEQAYQNQANQINSNMAFGAKQLQTGRNTAGALAGIVGAGNKGYNQLNAQDASARQQNQLRVLNAREIIARAKQRSYDQTASAAAAMKGAGMQNIGGGADMVGAYYTAVDTPKFDKMFTNSFGTDATATATADATAANSTNSSWVNGAMKRVGTTGKFNYKK
jgi:hypothetical protein